MNSNNVILAGLVALAVLAACTAQADDDAESDTKTPRSRTTTSPSVAPGAARNLGPVVATREVSHGRYGLRVEVFALERTGRTVQSNWRLTVVTAQGDDRLQLGDLFSDGDGRAADFAGDAADGVVLIDPTTARAHLTASDGQGRCVCARDLVSSVIPVGGSAMLNATYAAPADDVTAMDVVVPRFGTFSGVPVQ